MDNYHRKYKSGQLYRHNKYDFIIQLDQPAKFGNWYFKVVQGVIPERMMSRLENKAHYDTNLDSHYYYSRDSIRTSFTLISGPAAEVLYGITSPTDRASLHRGEGTISDDT